MKQYVCVLIIALLHQATCFPVGEPLASVSPNAHAITPEVKGPEQKSDIPVASVTSVVSESVPSHKELLSDVGVSPTITSVKDVSPTITLVKDVLTQQSPIVADEQVNNKVVENTGSVKSIPEAKIDVQTAEVAVEQSESNKIAEQPKEANSQVNSVSVDEPKPVRNEVKSEIPQEERVKEEIKTEPVKEEAKPEKVIRDEVKSENVKEEVKSEKTVDEVKAEKVEEPKNVVASDEVKREEVPISSEESVRKSEVSSEEKTSVEHVVSDEKRESEEKIESVENKRESEETANLKPAEKPMEEPKKEEKKEEKADEKKEEKKEIKDEKKDVREESSVKPIAESHIVESAKPSTVPAVPTAVVVTEKLDQERDVIKREAAKDKHDEKKSTDIVKKDKLKGSSSVQKEDEIKNSKGQDKIVN